MDEPLAAKILILAGDEASARRWAEMLQDHEGCVWLSPAQMPEQSPPEVILTDQDLADRGYPEASRGWDSGDVLPPEVGLIRIGRDGPADVLLPADVAGRELRLACRLLARIVRLRRQVRCGTEIHHQLYRQALTDPLTGLPNRRAWNEMIAPWLATWTGAPGRLCLAILDLDHFKRINDKHGHTVGDEVLRAAAKAFRDSLRQDDFVARLGGDEFGLLLHIPGQVAAAAVVDRVRSSLTAVPVRTVDGVVTASAGFHLVPTCPAPLPSPDTLLAAADTALREAKQQGRNRTMGS